QTWSCVSATEYGSCAACSGPALASTAMRLAAINAADAKNCLLIRYSRSVLLFVQYSQLCSILTALFNAPGDSHSKDAKLCSSEQASSPTLLLNGLLTTTRGDAPTSPERGALAPYFRFPSRGSSQVRGVC